jgi:hypothetical protein
MTAMMIMMKLFTITVKRGNLCMAAGKLNVETIYLLNEIKGTLHKEQKSTLRFCYPTSSMAPLCSIFSTVK